MGAAAAVRAELPAVTENPLGSLAEWVALNRRAEAEAREVLVAGGREAIARAGHPADGEAVATAHAIAVVVGPVALLGGAVLAGSLLVIGAIVMAAPRFVRRERAR